VTLDVDNLLPDGILTDVWGGLPGRVSKEKLRGFVVPRARPRSSARSEVTAIIMRSGPATIRRATQLPQLVPARRPTPRMAAER